LLVSHALTKKTPLRGKHDRPSKFGLAFRKIRTAGSPFLLQYLSVTKYLLGSTILGGCSVVFILQTIKSTKDRRDSNRIYQFLCRSVKDGQFCSSEAISAVTNLQVSRIADLCSKHGHIERKQHQRHMWRVRNWAEAHDAAIRVYDEAGNVIDTHEHTGDFKEP
jgi:hypothetical protein